MEDRRQAGGDIRFSGELLYTKGAHCEPYLFQQLYGNASTCFLESRDGVREFLLLALQSGLWYIWTMLSEL